MFAKAQEPTEVLLKRCVPGFPVSLVRPSL